MKFADADLVGVPLRVTVSGRSLQQGGVEVKRRDREEVQMLPIAEATASLGVVLRNLKDEAAAAISPVEYPGADEVP